MTAQRLSVKIDLPAGEDVTHWRRVLTDILEGHAVQINRGATISVGTATHTSRFTVDADLNLVNADAGSVTAFLPKAIDAVDQKYIVKKMNANAEQVHVQSQSGETIDGQASVQIATQFTTLQVVSNGANWFII